MGVAVYLGQIADQIVSMITCFFFHNNNIMWSW